MQRHDLIAAMGELHLRGMAAAFDEAVVQGIRQRRTVEEILGELLRAEAAERQSRSIRYRLGIAGLPEIKDLDGFRFDLSPVNEALVRSLHAGAFLAERRNAVLVGGTGTGKTHLSVAIAAQVIRVGARAKFFNVVDLVNRLEAESRNGKAGVIHMSKSMAMEWVGHGIRVNTISPGYTATPMNTRPEMVHQTKLFEEQTPMGRMGTVDEMVGPAIFLLSDAASFVTGVDLLVDGGFCCW